MDASLARLRETDPEFVGPEPIGAEAAFEIFRAADRRAPLLFASAAFGANLSAGHDMAASRLGAEAIRRSKTWVDQLIAGPPTLAPV